jgi:hypothetical protein
MAEECIRTSISSSEGSENFYSHLKPAKRFRRQLIAPLFRIADTGLFGLTPLRTHILVCGFPRSGTTLLQMMLENGIPGVRRFGREVGAWRAATYSWRNHAVVISKVPQDIFRLQSLRDFYQQRQAKLRIILMVRDPRDVLTSQRKTGGPTGYCVGPQRWLNYYNAFQSHRSDADVLVVRYEELVSKTAMEQQRIEAFTGETSSRPFTDFHSIDRPDFETNTLNGLRPVEQSLIARWSGSEHRERIRQLLETISVLPEALIQLGYESNDRWISLLRSTGAA